MSHYVQHDARPSDLEFSKFSLFHNDRKTTPAEHVLLVNFIEDIRSGTWKEQVARCRELIASDGEAAYKKSRGEVTVVSLSARMTTRKKTATPEEKEVVHSGLLQLDLDGKDHPEMSLAEIRERVESLPFVVACFVSLSGKGIKAIARIAPSEETHAGCWEAARRACEKSGLLLDRATKDVVRLCYISYDPEVFFRPDAVELGPVDLPQRDEREEASATKFQPGGKNGTVSVEFAREVLKELAMKLGRPDRADWIKIASATFDGVGVETGARLLSESFPEEEGDDYVSLAETLQFFVPWDTLREFAVNTEDPDELLADMSIFDEFPAQPSPPQKLSLREQAYNERFDPSKTPPPDEICLILGDAPVAARGNITVIQGKSKVGKSAVISAILGAMAREDYSFGGDTLCFSRVGYEDGAIIHLDTEQSRADWHRLVSLSVNRSGLDIVSSRVISLSLVKFTRSERVKILRETLAFEKAKRQIIDLVIIDGIADLCDSPNDEEAALELVSRILALCHEYEVAIVCVLHENPSSIDGKTRGHLGSELNRKAFANLRIDKDSETAISTIWGSDMRKVDIPKGRGFCFAWNATEGMHTFLGMAADLRTDQRRNRKEEEARTEWERIFEAAAASGESSVCPKLTAQEAIEIEQDISGTEKRSSFDAMKKRMQRAENLGILKKAGPGKWMLNTAGQSGQDWDGP